MSKRRNAKKEKASRNKAYARQFRKQSSGSYSGGKRFSNRENKSDTSEENNLSSSESSSRE